MKIIEFPNNNKNQIEIVLKLKLDNVFIFTYIHGSAFAKIAKIAKIARPLCFLNFFYFQH